MMEEFAMAIGSRLVAIEDVFPSSFEYRLHTIKTTHIGNEAVAIIYDGEQEIHREYDKEYHQAIIQAKAWIDERDEPISDI